MRRPEGFGDVAVILAALVLVFNEHGKGCAGGRPFKDTAEDSYLIILASLCSDARLPRTTPGELLTDKVHVQTQAGRAPIDHYANGRTVRCTKCFDPEDFAKCVAHGKRPGYFRATRYTEPPNMTKINTLKTVIGRAH